MAAPRQEENHRCAGTEGALEKGDGGGSPQRALRKVSQKDWPHSATDHPGNGVGIPGPASGVSTVPTIAVFLGLDAEPHMRLPGGCGSDSHHEASVRLPPCLDRELSVSRSGVHCLTFRTAAQRLLRLGCCL